MENKQEPIVIKKIHRLETNKITMIVLLFVILILVLEVFCFCYFCNKIKSTESSVEKSLTKPTTPADENEISYYRELSNKTDVAIDRIIIIVTSFSAILSLFGLLLAFKVPMEISKKIKEVEEKINDTKNRAEKVKCQSEVFMAYNSTTYLHHDNSSLVSENMNKAKRLSKIIDQTPEDSSAYRARAKTYARLAQLYKEDNKRHNVDYYNRALADYFNAIALGADAGECYNIIGMLYKELEDKENALLYCNKAIAVDSNNNMFFINRGNCYGKLGKYQEALKDFEKAITLDAEEMSAYFGRSYIYRNMYKEGKDETKKKEYRALEVKDLEKVLEIDPSYLPAKNRLSELTQGSAE